MLSKQKQAKQTDLAYMPFKLSRIKISTISLTMASRIG